MTLFDRLLPFPRTPSKRKFLLISLTSRTTWVFNPSFRSETLVRPQESRSGGRLYDIDKSSWDRYSEVCALGTEVDPGVAFPERRPPSPSQPCPRTSNSEGCWRARWSFRSHRRSRIRRRRRQDSCKPPARLHAGLTGTGSSQADLLLPGPGKASQRRRRRWRARSRSGSEIDWRFDCYTGVSKLLSPPFFSWS